MIFMNSLLLICIFVMRWSYARADAAPKLNPFAFPTDLREGSRARVLCSAYLGDQPVDFRWLKDGRPLLFGRMQQLDATLSELVLEPLKLDHTGNYTCVVSNEYGSDEVTATLFVRAPPRWIKEPQDAGINVGGKLLIDCEAVGSPPVQIIWKRRSPVLGDIISVTESQRVHILANNSLSLTGVQKAEDGLYMCEASNGIGEPLRKSVQIVIYEYPVITRGVDHVIVERGRRALMSCSASGDAPFSLTWRKNGRPLNNVSDRVTFSEHEEVEGTNFTLVINSAELSDEGLYTCAAANTYGSDEKDIRLVLVEKPQPPEDIEIVDVWSQSARIRWSAPSSGNSPILGYTVEYWSQSGAHQNLSTSSTSTSCILRDMNPFTLYKLQVWALNAVGTSDPSDQMQFMTAKEEPSAPPTDLTVVDKGSTFVQLSWKPPPPENWNGVILGYYVGYKQSSSKLPYTYNTQESTDDSVYYVLRGLKRGTRYVISVKAFNEIGSGPQSQEVSVKTHSHEPPPRPSLLVTNIGSTHIQLSWTLRDETKTSVHSYTLSYRKESDKWQEITIPDPFQSSFALTNLDSGVTYQVYLSSNTDLGMSEPSDTATVQTMAEALFHPSAAPNSPTSRVGLDDFTQTLYIVVPIAVATVIIVTVIIAACVYVYSKRPIAVPDPYGSLPPDKNFCYVATMPRHHVPPTAIYSGSMVKQGSPSSTVPLTRTRPEEDDEPIYESVMEEIRCKIKQRAFEEDQKIGCGTIV